MYTQHKIEGDSITDRSRKPKYAGGWGRGHGEGKSKGTEKCGEKVDR